MARLIRQSVGMSGVLREPRFLWFRSSGIESGTRPMGRGRRTSVRLRASFFIKETGGKEKFGTPNSHLSVLRYCRAIPRVVAFGVRLQSLMALHRLRSSNAPRSVIFELRGRAQKLPSLLATPFRPPERRPPFVLLCDKRSKNASAFFDLWIQRNRNQRKLIYNPCRRFLRLPSPSLRSGERNFFVIR